MRTKLALVAISGFTISALCLGGAFALSGGAIANADFAFGGFGLPRCEAMGSAVATSRTLPWNGDGDRVAVDLPANAFYKPGSGDQLVVKGDPRIISHVYVRDGVVGIDCNPGGGLFFSRPQRIEMTLPGRKFRTFEVRGSGDMQLAALSQPEAQIMIKGSGDVQADGQVDRLTVQIAGSGNLTARGATNALDLDINGSGDALLSGLVAKNADVRIDGSGDVELAARDAGHVSITGNGSGDVTAEGSTDDLKVAMHGSGDAKLGALSAKNADVHLAGSGDAEVAPAQSLTAGIAGSGDVQLRTEPATLDASISGSGEIIHPDGTTQDRRSLRKRHARADEGADRADVAAAAARDEDADARLERAQTELSARIKERVAHALENAGVENGH